MTAPRPDWQSADGSVSLYCGDCLEIMPKLGKVDAVVTDPPYETEAHTLQRRINRGRSRGGSEDAVISEPLSFSAISSETRSGFSQVAVEKCDGWILAFCQAEAVSDWRASLVSAGASYKRSCVWIKRDGMPQYSGDRPGMGYESIVAAWGGKGGSRWNGGGRHGVFDFSKGEPVRWGHPTQKPIALMRELIVLFSDSFSLVLDPFMGSGTTGVACVQLGRRFIGVEIEPKYFKIAVERIQAAIVERDSSFLKAGTAEVKLEQENML